MAEVEGIGAFPRLEEELFNEEEAKFVETTGHMYPFHECVSLIKHGERTLFKDTDFDTVEEANKLINEGWFPVPF